MIAVVGAVASLLAALPAQAQDGGKTVGTLRIPLPRDDGTLTPYTFNVAYPLMTLVYDTLFWRRADGSPEPWLATGVRSGDLGRRLTIGLRSGVRWHDGRPVTAQDVKFTFDYFKSRYQRRFTPELSSVQRTEVVDDMTVAIHLSHPAPGFEDQPLADMPILPKHLWEGLPRGRVPAGETIGSGPYQLVQHDPGRGYRFQANRGYFRGPPRVETIEVPFISDFERTVRALKQRQVDMIPATLPRRTETEVRDPSFKIGSGDLYAGTALMFNLRRGPFNGVRARRAVSMALDLDRVAQSAVGQDPLAFPAIRGYLHPDSGWAAGDVLHRFDEGLAHKAFRELRLPPIRILAPDNDPVKQEAGRQVVLALQRVGQAAGLETVSPAAVAAAVGENGSSPSFDAAILSIPALASDDPGYLSAIFGSDSRLAPLNYSGYRSERFDALARRAARETAPGERRRVVGEELKLLARQDIPAVALFYPKGAFAFRPQIYDGWVFVKGTGILDKRSFLASAAGAPPAGGPPNAIAGAGGVDVLEIVAIGLLVGVVAVLALSSARQMRRG